MELNHFIKQSYNTLLHYAGSFQVILLHPFSRYRSLTIAKLMQEQPYPTFYYSMGAVDTNLQAFLISFWQDMVDQAPHFGRRINQYIQPDQIGMWDEMLADFQQDLAELSEEPYFLVLDNYDVSEQSDDLHMFLEQLIWNLPEHCQVIVSSRTLPRLSWLALIARRKALILKDSELVTYDPYGLEESDGLMRFDVSALGPDTIRQGDSSIEDWEGHLPRLLFIFALERPSVTRTEICSAFWPKLDLDQAVNVFHVTKRRLHKALNVDVLVHTNGYYQVNPMLSVQYDVVNFTNALVQGRLSEGEEAAEAWQNARQLYQGPFLQGHDDPWILEQREAYQDGYLEAVIELSKIWADTGKENVALQLLNQTSHNYWHYEPIHRELMIRYEQFGRRSEVASHYQQLTHKLAELGAAPSPELQTFYHELMA